MKIVSEVVIVSVVSLILSYITSDFLVLPKGFLLYTIIQFVAIYFLNSKTKQKQDSQIESIDTVIDEFIDGQSINFDCPCQRNTHRIFITPNDDIILDCLECKNSYKLDVQYTPILITTPLNSDVIYDKLKKEQEYISKNE